MPVGKQSEDLLMNSPRRRKVSCPVACAISSIFQSRSKKHCLPAVRQPRSSSLFAWASWLRWFAVAASLILLVHSNALASFSLTFQGLVRTLNAGGSITLASPAGAVADSTGNVFMAVTGNNRVVEVTAQGTVMLLKITGLSPALSSPTGLAIDGAGNLYIADTGNSRVVKVTVEGAGSAISTGSVTLSSPRGVALDQSGNIFIADTGNNRIVKVTSGGSAAALTITVSSGTSMLSSPEGLAVGVAGKQYIADSGSNRVVTVAAGSTAGIVASILGGVTRVLPLKAKLRSAPGVWYCYRPDR